MLGKNIMANNNDNNMILLWIHLSKASTVNRALKMYVPTHCRSVSTASSDLCDKFQGKLIVAPASAGNLMCIICLNKGEHIKM